MKKNGFQIRDIVECIDSWIADSVKKGSIGEVVRYNGVDVEVMFFDKLQARLMSQKQLKLIFRPYSKKDIIKHWLIQKIKWI